jgi:hypothetical protein
MGGPSAAVFFSKVIVDDIEPFLRKIGIEVESSKGGGKKPKPRRQTSFEISFNPTLLGLTPGDMDSETYYGGWDPDRPLCMGVSVRHMENAKEYWEHLLENDVLPEDMNQVVTVGCYTKGPVAYDAVNALIKAIERELEGQLATPASK